MFMEINAAVQSLRVLTDLVKANQTLRNFNELVAAVYEVNAKLLAVQSVALESQEKQAALTNCISELEKEIGELKNWNREAERYQLTEIAPGMVAYRLKAGMENNEPPHQLCANCFAKKEKSFLQSEPPGVRHTTHRCPRCQSTLVVPSTPRLPRGREEIEDWRDY